MHQKCTCGGDNYREHHTPKDAKVPDVFIACYECGTVICEGIKEVKERKGEYLKCV